MVQHNFDAEIADKVAVMPRRRGVRTGRLGENDPNIHSRRASMNAMGPVVYAARLHDGTIKIGYTTQLSDRLHVLTYTSKGVVELLALRPGSHDDEMAIHADLVDHRAHGREYYAPTQEVMAVVDEMRVSIGLSVLAS